MRDIIHDAQPAIIVVKYLKSNITAKPGTNFIREKMILNFKAFNKK